MTAAQQPSVTFLALSYPATPAHVVYSLANALGQQGWQVHWVTTAPFSQGFPQGDTTLIPTSKKMAGEPARLGITGQLVSIELAPSGKEQPSAQSLKKAAEAILAQQSQQGLISPLFHSFDDASAYIGQYFKACYGWRWLHTPQQNRMGAVQAWQRSDPEPDQWLLWQEELERDTANGVTDEVQRQRQRHYGLSSKGGNRWQAIATHLSNIYRQHLAAYVGARNLEIPPVITLPLAPVAERLPLLPQKREPILANA